jgi:hypothetical protein
MIAKCCILLRAHTLYMLVGTSGQQSDTCAHVYVQTLNEHLLFMAWAREPGIVPWMTAKKVFMKVTTQIT